MPKPFEEYVREGIIKKSTPDVRRAEFLVQETEKSLIGLNERLELIGINENNANSIIKDCHDIILELIRAKMLVSGYNSANSHEAEVAYLKILKFPDTEVAFVNEIRYYRNGATYYGKILSAEYAGKVVAFTRKIIQKIDFETLAKDVEKQFKDKKVRPNDVNEAVKWARKGL
ncbi:MAG: hypothetical protein ACP5OA_00215 [Candidatus Woesearchaeota archaeon]